MTTVAEETRNKYWEELSEVASALASNCSKLLRHKGKVYGNVIDGGHLWSSEYIITVNPGLSDREDATTLEPVDHYLAQNLLKNLTAEFPEFLKIKDWRELTKNDITTNMTKIIQMVTHRKTFRENCEVSQSWKSSHANNSIDDALIRFLESRPKPRKGTRGTRDGFL